MSVAKNIDISSSSTVSFEDAIKKGLHKSTKRLITWKVLGLKSKKYALAMVISLAIT